MFLKETSRQRPIAVPWLNCPLAQKHPVFMGDNGPDNDLRVIVMNPAAIVTNHALMGVIIGHPAREIFKVIE